MPADLEALYHNASSHFAHWDKTKDLIDQMIDLELNLRQSGHPGGSRSKVHVLLTTMLSGAMRWDIRHPEKRYGDRFVLAGGHTNPLVYATLAVLNEAMRTKYKQTGNKRYFVPVNRGVFPEDLLTLRRNKGLPGHAEMAGKTLFFKFNTGPSGHGMPAAAGEALALKMAGCEEVRVFAMEGEGGLTPGGAHETKNSAWALGLNNLYFLIDWNDFGIDDQNISSVVYGDPQLWFSSYGWRTLGTEQGMEWETIAKVILEMTHGDNPHKLPNAAWFKTRKGRGYGVYDNKSHGVPHGPMDSPAFWETKRPFAEKYGAVFEGFGQPAPATEAEQRAQTGANIERVMDVLRKDQALVNYLADTLVALGDSVPDVIPGCRVCGADPFKDERIYDFENYPADMYAAPGTRLANRAALAKWGAWINTFGKKNYGRPLLVVSSADLAESTNIAGFGRGWGDDPGFGRYNRDSNTLGALLPQEITEFANAGIAAGMATVNFADNPFEEFNGFYSGTSTYGSFVYLHYGLFRLYSQLAQDCDLKVGKILWVAGHSGPETADDSRTHFGIFSPGATQMFPKGHIINLHPWEYNEVPVMLAAAFKQTAPIVALHLTRPPVAIPDRKALGMPSHFAAATGAYVIRPYKAGQKAGVVIVQGTSTTAGIVDLLPKLDEAGLNVKIVAALSPELFAVQPASYRNEVLSAADRANAMVITSEALRNMQDWIDNPVVAEYSMSADWDNRWRTGGTIPEVLAEAHLSTTWLLAGIERFAHEQDKRLSRLQATLDAARAG